MPPRLARLLAVVGALALVAAGFGLRAALSGDDDGSTAAGPGSPSPGGGEGRFRVLCDADLADACDALARLEGVGSLEVERVDDALSALAEDGAPYDAWLTLDPWPAIAAYLADPGAPAEVPLVEVASAPVAVLVDPATSECEADPTWTCLARPARPPVTIPGRGSALGPLVLAHAAAGLVGRTDFGTNAVGEAVRAQLADLRAGTRGSARELLRQILLPGTSSAAIGPQALAEQVADSAQGRPLDLTAAPLAPVGTIGVVLAGVGPRGAEATRALAEVVTGQTVADALAAEGWTGPPARSAGLPDPDVVYALQEEIR